MDDRHIVAIDLGSSKIALAVAKVIDQDVQVIYYKEMPSEGIRNSYVFNAMKVTGPLKRLIEDAQQELNIKITQAVVGMPKYRVRQETGQAKIERNPEECISQEEVNELKTEALENYPLDDVNKEELFGAVAQSFSNGEEFQLVENDIIGMPCDVLEGNFKIFIGKRSALRSIDVTFNQLKIGIAKKYFTPDPVAKIVLTQSEMENGVALVDFGGGVTSVSVYYGNIMRHYASIPFGGNVITSDIRTECMISEQLAENIKLAYGACMPDKLQSLSEKIIQINSNSAAPNKQLPVKYLSEIITHRVREIAEAILWEIQQSGFADNLRNGIVLTGGCADLTNCANYIKEISGYSVRSGYPRHMFSASGCEGVFETSAAVCTGLVMAASTDHITSCILADSTVNIGGEVVFGGQPQTPEPGIAAETEIPVGEDGEPIIFQPEELPEPEPEKKPEPVKAKPKKKPIWKKMTKQLGTLFDNFATSVDEEV